MWSFDEESIFLNQNSRMKHKQSGNAADAVLNDLMDIESNSSKILFDTRFLWIVLVIQKTKITSQDLLPVLTRIKLHIF